MHYGSVCGRALAAAAIVGLCSPFSNVVTAAPLYENWTRRVEGCPNIFSPVLCRDFDFILESERAARFEEDRVLARPRSAVIIDACTVAALIRETEALPSSRFMELRFERITVSGTLHLSEIDPRARLSFVDVNFVPKPSRNDADAELDAGSRSRPTISPASSELSAFSIEGTFNIAAPEPPECVRSEPLDPAFARASVVIERSGFRDRVRFEGALFDGGVIVSGSEFDSNFDIVESDVGGDLVLETSAFASDLELGRNTILRGQIVVDGVRVGGDMAIDGIEVIDTYLDPEESETLPAASDSQEVETPTAAPEASSALDMTPACVCTRRDGSFNVDLEQIDLDGETIARPSREVVEQTSCKRLRNLPRCPRSNGFDPVLIEISHTDVAGLFSLTGLQLGSRNAGYRPFKSSSLRHDCDDLWEAFFALKSDALPGGDGRTWTEYRADLEPRLCPTLITPRPHPQAPSESSLSRLKNANILLDDVSVSGAALLQGNQGDTFYLYQSSIERMSSEGNEFHWLVVARNEFGAFSSVKDTFYRGLAVVRNNVGGSMELDSLVLSAEVLRKQEEPWKLSATVTHNLVGRDLSFTPYNLVFGIASEIDLSTNRVGGELALSLPVAEAPWVPAEPGAHAPKHLSWSGLIPLRSLAVDGALVVGFANTRVKDHRMIVDFDTLAKEGVLCGARDDWPARVHLDLANTTAKNIQWAVPLRRPEGSPADCVSWEGVGLRYDNWEAGAGWGGREENDIEDSVRSGDREDENDDEGSARRSEQFPELLRLWRELYVRTAFEPRAGDPPPDPLHHMADQLAKIGEQKASRQVRADAKRAGFPLSTDDFLTSLGNGVARIVFFPTDFGTKPERAFIVLAVVTLAAWVVYTWLVCHYRESWWQFERARDMLEKRDRIREAMRQHLANRTLDRNGDDLDAAEYRLTEVLDRHAPKPTESDSTSSDASGAEQTRPESRQSTLEPGLSEAELRHISAVPGFMQYDRNRQPQYFNLVRYAVDTMIPVIDLHAYNQYYPMRGWVLNFTMLQHVVGWWVLTSFLASIAVF